jgi:hypothetical protein
MGAVDRCLWGGPRIAHSCGRDAKESGVVPGSRRCGPRRTGCGG